MTGSRQIASSEGALAWRFLDEGFAPRGPQTLPSSWDASSALVAAFEAMEAARFETMLVDLCVAGLDRALASSGGDPLRDDWRDFRPLTLQREEGWSDWLAHLILTGDRDFLGALFPVALPSTSLTVSREEILPLDLVDPMKGHYRSDLLITWEGRPTSIHVEIKVGDTQLDKTWAEAAHLRRTHGGEWHHFLLVLPDGEHEALRRKKLLEPPSGDGPPVSVITWTRIERALRQALLRESTPAQWRGLARAFTGALGQLKLSRPVLARAGDGRADRRRRESDGD